MSLLYGPPTFDERDLEILNRRTGALDEITEPRVGDFVEFVDGTMRRISYIWPDEAGGGVQTSAGGSYYLGNGYVSMSGGLRPCVAPDTLTPTNGQRPGSVWFFHHDYSEAHNGVDTEMLFRVYKCSEEAP